MSDYIFKLPDLGEGTVESEIGEWFVNVGDDVAEETVVATMMTDKAAIELSSPVSGKVLSLAGEPGDVIPVGAPLIVFAAEGHAAAATEEQDTGTQVPTPDKVSARKTNGAGGNGSARKIVTSPAVRRRAKESGIDLTQVSGSGPGGRISRADFDQFVAARSGTQPILSVPALETSEQKVIGLRRIIAERMSASKREIPHFTYVEEIDITELESLRKYLNQKNDGGQRMTLLPLIGLALVRTLRDFPQCNASYDKQTNVITQHGSVHLGVATQTPDGLKVPVVRNAESRNVENLSAEIRRVSEAARNNTARKDELSGSTITLTSLGRLGGIVSTPVINMPEVAIIGVNRAVERPMVVDGQIAIRLMMNLSSSFDHRFVDGYDAAAMIQQIKDMLEHPATIFMG